MQNDNNNKECVSNVFEDVAAENVSRATMMSRMITLFTVLAFVSTEQDSEKNDVSAKAKKKEKSVVPGFNLEKRQSKKDFQQSMRHQARFNKKSSKR